MLIIYASKTGNTELFLSKLHVKKYLKINANQQHSIKEKFIMMTYTTGFGEIPEEVDVFLKYNDNYKFLHGVIGSGNKNFGNFFAKAADLISVTYDVPIIMKYELTGNKNDVKKLQKYLKNIQDNY